MENASKLNLNDSKNIDKLETEIEKEIRDKIQEGLDKTKNELGSDTIGFGEFVYKKYPKEWNATYKKEWSEKFSELEVSIDSKVYVRRVGLTE